MPIAKNSGGTFTPAPEGTHLARCIGVISLGTQPQSNPKFNETFKIMLNWELPGETVQNGDGKAMPMIVSKEYTLSLNEKSGLYKDLKGWRGRDFTEEELKGFEVANVAGHACLLAIIHKTSGKGNKYAEIASVSKPMKGQDCPAQVHAKTVYELEHGRNETFNALPEWIRKKIEQCREWTNAPATHSPEPAKEDDENSVPF